jgi:ABC-type sulfate/molybdate transport systems ATPase subunit
MIIDAKNITKSFGRFVALKGVSISVPAGQLLALLGPSGCGKTTLLRIIAGLDAADSGTIHLDGKDATGVTARDRGVGFVFQHYALFRHMTIFENIAFGLRVRQRSHRPCRSEIHDRVQALLKLVQLEWLVHHYPGQLSGGQRQRVALARALAVEPRVLLLDEPFGSLDAQTRTMMQEVLLGIWEDLHTTVLFVTHDIEEALFLADRVVVMSAGPGRIIEEIAVPLARARHPDVVYTPEFVRLKRHCAGLIRDEEVPIRVKITIKGSDMIIDLSGCSAERKAAINSRTYAGARVAYKALTGPLDPVNEGSFRALKVVIPEGNIMMAKFPAPMSGWSAIVPTVVDTIVVALAKAMPDRVPAGHHGLLGGSVVFFGLHPKTKRRFIVQSIEGGGWGGRPFEDGESATVSVCQGDVRNGSIEGIELKCPVLVESRALRQDSCGAGRYRGGLGLDMKVRNLIEGKWNFERTRRSKCPPWGIAGGTAGEPGGNLLKLPGEKAFKWITGANIPVPLNSLAIVRTGGGGGWGDPLQRDAALVAADAAEGLISRRAAQELYGVVLRGSMSLDESATQRLRDRLRSRRKVRPAKRAKQQKLPSLTKGRKRR